MINFEDLPRPFLFPLQLPSKATQFFSVILMLLHYQKASTRWSYQRVRLLPRALIYFTCKMKCQFSLAPELFRIQNSAMEGNWSGIDPYSITQKPNVRLEIFHITEIQIGSSQTISTILKYNLGIHQHKHCPKMSTAKNTCARLLLWSSAEFTTEKSSNSLDHKTRAPTD